MELPLTAFLPLKVAVIRLREKAEADTEIMAAGPLLANPTGLLCDAAVVLSSCDLCAALTKLRDATGKRLAEVPARSDRLILPRAQAAQLTRDLFGEQYKLAVTAVAERAGIGPGAKPAAWTGEQLRCYINTLCECVADPSKRAEMLTTQQPTEASGNEQPALET